MLPLRPFASLHTWDYLSSFLFGWGVWEENLEIYNFKWEHKKVVNKRDVQLNLTIKGDLTRTIQWQNRNYTAFYRL